MCGQNMRTWQIAIKYGWNANVAKIKVKTCAEYSKLCRAHTAHIHIQHTRIAMLLAAHVSTVPRHNHTKCEV